MDHVLITGSGGLLGSRLVALLGGRATIHRWRGDLSEGVSPAALPDRIDAVVYLAQSRRYREFPDAAIEVARVNAFAALELAQHARERGAKRFIYASTGGVYAPSAEPLIEDAPLADVASMSFYAATKLTGERLLSPFASEMDIVILRPFFIYGPGQDGSMLLPRLVATVRDGRPVALSGSEGIRMNPIHVDDAARATVAALALTGRQVINLAGPSVWNLRAIASAIGDKLGRAPVFEVSAGREGSDLLGDIGHMTALLHRPVVELPSGLEDLLV